MEQPVPADNLKTPEGKPARPKMFGLQTRPKGEPYVWFTAMGLTLGLAMIIGLLGLILVKGVNVFWPKPVPMITLNEDSAFRVGGSTSLMGVVRKEQVKTVRTLSADGTESAPLEEWQLFVGNKDIYGFSFKFLDTRDIARIEYPDNAMRIERMEYGDAFAFPVELRINGEGTVAVSDPAFLDRLHELTEEANQRRRQIKKVEKKEIGRINHKLEKLRLERKTLDADRQQGRLDSIDARMAVLEEQYRTLAARARALRGMQTEHQLIYRTADEKTVELATGQIVHFYFPNRISFFERIHIFLERIWGFVAHDPREANTEGGVFPAIFGTFVMTILMSLAVTPFGVLAAIYLREYAKQGTLVRSVRIAVNNLAGVPSIVFGVFGLGFFVYFVGGSLDHIFFKDALPTPTFGTGGIVWASLTLALMTVPVVIVATEEALASVPRGMREGSLACGASKWQTIQRIVLPAAAPGILTGLVLAMARGAGEVAPLMLVGAVKLAPNLPVDGIFPFVHLERKFMHLGFHIYDLGFQSPDSEAAKPMVFATTLLLILLVVLLNLGAIMVRERLRRKYATGAF